MKEMVRLSRSRTALLWIQNRQGGPAQRGPEHKPRDLGVHRGNLCRIYNTRIEIALSITAIVSFNHFYCRHYTSRRFLRLLLS
jgi:hypothetical protein